MTQYVAVVGTSSDGGLATFDVDESGALSSREETPAGDSPSFLALSPDGKRCYAVNETVPGGVAVFDVDETGTLTRRDEGPSGDDGPCHCAVDPAGEYLLVAHYGGGSVSMLPLGPDGVEGPCDVVRHEGSSVDPDRQTRPYPHSITPSPDGSVAYVADLGTDEVLTYELDREEDRLRRRGVTRVHEGAGPRHLAFHPGLPLAYLVNEVDSTLSTLRVDTDRPALAEAGVVSTLPEGAAGENRAADVAVHPRGHVAYVSNRGHDSVAVCDLRDPVDPEPVDFVPAGGACPRHLCLSHSGEHLYAENKDSDAISVFAVDAGTGALSPTGHVAETPSPTCMVLAARE